MTRLKRFGGAVIDRRISVLLCQPVQACDCAGGGPAAMPRTTAYYAPATAAYYAPANNRLLRAGDHGLLRSGGCPVGNR